MVRRSMLRRRPLALLPVILFGVGCGSAMRTFPAAAPTAAVAPVIEPAPEPPAPPEDPVLTLIATSEGYFKAGQKELELGHVEAARQEFDKAVNVLLESTYGGRSFTMCRFRSISAFWRSSSFFRAASTTSSRKGCSAEASTFR
jgi:hypothetical protein